MQSVDDTDVRDTDFRHVSYHTVYHISFSYHISYHFSIRRVAITYHCRSGRRDRASAAAADRPRR
jgi:hypothetical protein